MSGRSRTPRLRAHEVPRTTYRYRSRRDDKALRERLLDLAREIPRYGYRHLHVLLRREAINVNQKRVERIYRELGLMVKRTRRERSKPVRCWLRLARSSRSTSPTSVDCRYAEAPRVQLSMTAPPSKTSRCKWKRAAPADVSLVFWSRQYVDGEAAGYTLRSDGNKQSILPGLAIEHRIDVPHIRPTKPTRSVYVQSLHSRLREECLNTSWFWNLLDARRKNIAWQRDYDIIGHTHGSAIARRLSSTESGSSKQRTKPS